MNNQIDIYPAYTEARMAEIYLVHTKLKQMPDIGSICTRVKWQTGLVYTRVKMADMGPVYI